MLTKNQKAKVLIDSTTPEGYGVCRLEERAVFVSSALPGERWEIQILKISRTAVWAKGIRLLEASPERCNSDGCPNPCGGCSLRFANYSEELRIKRTHVEDCLSRIGKQEINGICIHPSPNKDRYRNKAVFAVDTIDGKAAFGFYRPRSHILVPITDCLLQSSECIQAASAVADFMNRYSIPAYDEQTGKGTVRHIFWRESILGNRMLCIVAARGFGSHTEALVSELRESCPFLTGIVLNINKNKGNTVLAGDFYTLWGEPNVQERLCNNVFEISPRAFLQINPPQAEAMYYKALEFAKYTELKEEAPQTNSKLALDLYCGAGTVTLCLAEGYDRVIGAEIVPEAIENARVNAKQNRNNRVEFICADAAEIALSFRQECLKPDAIVVDPPRKGLVESVVRDIVEMEPKKIVYISCNPATLARDVERFSMKGYMLNKVEAFDMFPRTAHVETVVLMSRTKD